MTQLNEYRAWLLLGGDVDDVPPRFVSAIGSLNRRAGRVADVSRLYLSEPWGMSTPGLFYNQAVCLLTTLEPGILMQVLLEIEKDHGRYRSDSDAPESRTLDMDILLIEEQIIDTPGLQVPHPRMHLRRFALLPLAEIASEIRHPVLGKTIRELLNACSDPLAVNPAGPVYS